MRRSAIFQGKKTGEGTRATRVCLRLFFFPWRVRCSPRKNIITGRDNGGKNVL